jgi:phosphate transport system substrate-binding protein
MLLLPFTGCGQNGAAGAGDSAQSAETTAGDSSGGASGGGAITLVSREDGSGTRSAFIELFGILEDDVDQTALSAEITNNTAVMMTSVSGNRDAIGYISLGSLNDTVKALSIDGAAATTDNVKSGAYAISRPFLIAVKDDLSPAAKDFVSFIMSAEGQDIIEEDGYIRIDAGSPYAGTKPDAKIVVAGSSSVTPVMEVLREAYIEIWPDADVEIQQSDSSTGMNAAIDGICDIGMASRELKDSEIEKGLAGTTIAIDGIAVIVNKENAIQGLTKDQVKDVFSGTITEWSGLAG